MFKIESIFDLYWCQGLKRNLLGYSERSKEYRVYNYETQCVEESMHIRFDDKEPGSEILELVESFTNIHVSEEPSEPDQTPDSNESLEAEPFFKLIECLFK